MRLRLRGNGKVSLKPKARALSKEVLELQAAGSRATEIAKKLGIGTASVYRILNLQKDTETA
ncbi:MAG: helix-turn-helix domain-containing protein [Roseobacter sp.]